MIGVIDVEIQAANVSMPLYPVRAFVNSPSSIRLRNVPRKIGSWNITSVQIVAAYPDSSIRTANCVLTGGVWVGTIEGCPISGRSENGFTVFASGIDENGNPVSNYVLGKGLIEILEGDGTITPDAPSYYVHLYDEEPDQPKEGDMWPTDDGYVIWQDGEEHKLGISAEEVSTMISDEVPDIVTEKVEVGVGDNWRNYINETRKPYWNSDDNIWVWEDITGDPLESSAPEDTIELVFNGYYLSATIKLLLTEFEAFGEEGEYIMKLVFSDGTEHEVTYHDSVGYFTYNGTNYYPQGDVSQWVVDNYYTFEVEGGITFKFYRDSAMRNALGLATYDELETVANQVSSKQDKLNTTQLNAVNSNITAAKVAEYDEAMTKFNYELYSPMRETMTLRQDIFPITYTDNNTTYTVQYSDYGTTLTVVETSTLGASSTAIYLAHNNGTTNPMIVAATKTTGLWAGGILPGLNVKLNGSTPTSGTTPIYDVSGGLVLKNRAINRIPLSQTFNNPTLVFPQITMPQANDFILHVEATGSGYTPSLSYPNYYFYNDSGDKPEIELGKQTLIYISFFRTGGYLLKEMKLQEVAMS